jgi:ribonuclease R
MEQAIYSPKIEGHFALASEHYVHFTSPIRRYPDLTAHRIFDAHVRGSLPPKRHRRKLAGERAIAEALGEQCSFNERRAADAERELKLVYLLTLLQKRLGERFDGIVTGVTNFGMFVQLPKYLVDGLLRFSDLPEDWWEVDAEAGCVRGERSGHVMRIGDKLPVVVARIDLPARQLDLALAEPLPGTKPRTGPSPRPDSKKRPPRHPGKKGRAGHPPARNRPEQRTSGRRTRRRR